MEHSDLSIKTNKKHSLFFLFVFIFIFYLFIAINLPLSGDDWTWGTERGIQRLENKFADYNGRYLSNMLEILMTRFHWLRYILLSVFSTLLVYLVGKMTNIKDNNVMYLVSFLLVLLLPVDIFAQTYGWTAGFSNYNISIVLSLIYFVLVQHIFDNKFPSYSKKVIILVFILGLSSQMLIEHISTLNFFTATLVLIYSYVKYHRVSSLHISYWTSVVLGSIIMFSNGAYINTITGSDSYRTLATNKDKNVSLSEKIYEVYSNDMVKLLFPDNKLLLSIICLLIIILIINKIKVKKSFLYLLSLTIICTTLVYLNFIEPLLEKESSNVNNFEVWLSLIFIGTLFFTVMMLIEDTKMKVKLLYYLVAIILLTVPFLFITPFGARAVLASYVFFILFVNDLIVYTTRSINISTFQYKIVLKICISILMIFYIIVFSLIGTVNRERLSYLEQQVEANEQTIRLSELPFSEFMWMSSPPREHFNVMFKKFYQVPEKTEVKFIPYKIETKDK